MKEEWELTKDHFKWVSEEEAREKALANFTEKDKLHSFQDDYMREEIGDELWDEIYSTNYNEDKDKCQKQS